MKKILHITFESPSHFSGGGLGVLQSVKSLQHIGEVTYCGPNIASDCKYLIDGYEKCLYLNLDSVLGKLIALLKLVPNSFYHSWEIEKKNINIHDFDIVYIDFSRHGHIVKWAKHNGKKVWVRLHNIEHDYYWNAVKNSFSVFKLIKYLMIRRQENLVIKYADTLLFITENDLERAKKLYGKRLESKNLVILPICLERRDCLDVQKSSTCKYALITGSLWYEQNNKGIIWFINNVWDDVASKFNDFYLVIAGKAPNESLKREIHKHAAVKLIDSPQDMMPWFSNATLYIAPIFDGAGMKVKIAEALSYGLPIIGTNHAFIGYKPNRSCIYADSKREFIEAIANYLDSHEGSSSNFKHIAYETFISSYSYESSYYMFEELVRKHDNA
ncbi:MAG: glycosyltransferase [Candidatus Fimivivens sp.]|nr:glycosyltransferase [Candidatus Fimivivens sp.]